MNKKQKKMLFRIILSAVLVVVLHFIQSEGTVRFILYMVPYLIIGYDILIKAAKGIFNRQVFDENFLMAVATVGAVIIGLTDSGDYTEAVGVMLFYQIGELFQSYAVGKSRKNISALMDIRPDYASIEENGKLVRVDPNDIGVGSVIVVLPGEKVPIDGVVLEGNSSVDTSALTGESIPRDITRGEDVISGSINLTGVLKIKTSKEFGESTVSKILELAFNAGSRKSRSEKFISKFAAVYTPAVCLSALLLAVLPPLCRIVLGVSPEWGAWIYRSLTFLVISCPCALVISIPLSFFAGIGGASRQGILIKGSGYIEALAKTDTVVFDKTGTLTKGVFELSEVNAVNISEEKLLEYATLAESASSHPISVSLRSAYGKDIDRSRVEDIKEISGHGITAKVDGVEVAIGNSRLMDSLGVGFNEVKTGGTVVYVSLDGIFAGYIVISDRVKDGAKDAIKMLYKSGIKRTVMLTGDRPAAAEAVAKELEISEVQSGLLPTDKVTAVEKILEEKSGGSLVFVGDGINDAPVLSRADVGIAMGALGSDAAIEASDVVLMDDDPKKLPLAVKISKKCMRIVYQNIIFALGVKVICLVFASLGIADMWLAIFADVGVMIIAVLNAIRAMFIRK